MPRRIRCTRKTENHGYPICFLVFPRKCRSARNGKRMQTVWYFPCVCVCVCVKGWDASHTESKDIRDRRLLATWQYRSPNRIEPNENKTKYIYSNECQTGERFSPPFPRLFPPCRPFVAPRSTLISRGPSRPFFPKKTRQSVSSQLRITERLYELRRERNPPIAAIKSLARSWGEVISPPSEIEFPAALRSSTTCPPRFGAAEGFQWQFALRKLTLNELVTTRTGE